MNYLTLYERQKQRFKKEYLFYLCVCVWVCALYVGVHEGQKVPWDIPGRGVTDSYELLGTRLASSERAGSALTAEPSLMMWNGHHDHTEWAIGWLWEKELQREEEEGKERESMHSESVAPSSSMATSQGRIATNPFDTPLVSSSCSRTPPSSTFHMCCISRYPFKTPPPSPPSQGPFLASRALQIKDTNQCPPPHWLRVGQWMLEWFVRNLKSGHTGRQSDEGVAGTPGAPTETSLRWGHGFRGHGFRKVHVKNRLYCDKNWVWDTDKHLIDACHVSIINDEDLMFNYSIPFAKDDLVNEEFYKSAIFLKSTAS